MNILLCGEGVTDVGERGEYDVKLGDYIWNEGSIPVIKHSSDIEVFSPLV